MNLVPRGGQLSIYGNIVNVPSDENSTVHDPLRPINESQTIPIKLGRWLGYKQPYQCHNDNPKKVLDADTSELFETERIKVQDAWVDGITWQSSTCEEWGEFVQNPNTSSAVLQTIEIVKNLFSQLMFIIQAEKKILMMVGVKLMKVLQEWQIHYCRNQIVTDNMLPNVHVHC